MTAAGSRPTGSCGCAGRSTICPTRRFRRSASSSRSRRPISPARWRRSAPTERSARAGCGRPRPAITSPGSPNKRETAAASAADRARARRVRQGRRAAECAASAARKVASTANGEGGVTPMAQRVAVLGILNKRNGIVQNVTLHPGQSARWKDVIVRLARLRDDGAVGGGEADRRLRPGRRPAARQDAGTASSRAGSTRNRRRSTSSSTRSTTSGPRAAR